MEVEFVNTATKQPMTIYANLVFGVTYLPASHTTALLSIGGQMVPVEGTVEEAKQKIAAAKLAARKAREPKIEHRLTDGSMTAVTLAALTKETK